MPKIIENIREKLLEEAQKQVMKNGYSSMTIRSVAKACGVSVGTVYNYFSSKDMLVAGFMLEDWTRCLQNIRTECESDAVSLEGILVCICTELVDFTDKYTALFRDKNACVSYAADIQVRHRFLRSQIAEPILQVIKKKEVLFGNSNTSSDFLADFLAENVLTWTVEGRCVEEIVGILVPLL